MPVPALPVHPLLKQLELKNRAIQADFANRHKSAYEWLKTKGLQVTELRAHSTKLLTGATLSGVLLLASPGISRVATAGIVRGPTVTIEKYLKLLQDKSNFSPDDEEKIQFFTSQFYGVRSAFELDGNRLPTYKGKVGLEQHLARFPGDNLSTHGSSIEAGMAPGVGAFGYFADSNKSVAQMENEERFYVVLQTFLIPDWNKNWSSLKAWYKFRKFIIINPQNGKAVIAALGDSGPAVSTGKQFGASPETMLGLGFYPRATKGDVIMLFLDDPTNSIPLGPLRFGSGGSL